MLCCRESLFDVSSHNKYHCKKIQYFSTFLFQKYGSITTMLSVHFYCYIFYAFQLLTQLAKYVQRNGKGRISLKPWLAKRPRNVRLFLECEKHWKRLLNCNVISVRIFIAFHVVKTNVCYIKLHRLLSKRGFYVFLHSESAAKGRIRLQPWLAKRPGNVRSFLECEKHWKRLPNCNVILVSICIALHMLKMNVCYITFHRRLTQRGFNILLRSESVAKGRIRL